MEAELLATLIDTINQWGRTWAVANSKKGAQIPEAPRVKRPYEAERRPLTMADLLAAVKPAGA